MFLPGACTARLLLARASTLKMIHDGAVAQPPSPPSCLPSPALYRGVILHNRQITDRANGKLINRHWGDASLENGNMERECQCEITRAGLRLGSHCRRCQWPGQVTSPPSTAFNTLGLYLLLISDKFCVFSANQTSAVGEFH